MTDTLALTCPNCHEDLDDTDMEIFDVIECDNCGVELEVTGEDPIVLSLIAEDDFEDEEEEEDDKDEEIEE